MYQSATNHGGRQAVTIDSTHQLSVLGLGAKQFLPPGKCTSETPQTWSHRLLAQVSKCEGLHHMGIGTLR